MQKGVDHVGVSVVYFCHDGKGNFVMGLRNSNTRDEHGRWDIGAGAVEFGETVEQCLRKEIKEEYCTDVLRYEFLGYRDLHRTHNEKPTHWLTLDFKVLIDPSKVRNGEPHKFDEVQWFRIGKLPKNVHSQLKNFFKIYRGKLWRNQNPHQ